MIDVSNLKDALKTLGFVAYGDNFKNKICDAHSVIDE